jgi:RNA polymerase sigma-70 factor (ECF subfamily)
MEPELLSNGESLAILLRTHRKFLAFLERRVRSKEDAEEILQSALAKAVEHREELEQDTVVAWFYRVLRNALADYYRRIDSRARRLGQQEVLADAIAEQPQALQQTVCECFRELVPTLKPEYAEILSQVDLGDASISQAAEALGITPNNAGVRLHRAREALRKSLEATCRTCAVHGCYDCTCEKC